MDYHTDLTLSHVEQMAAQASAANRQAEHDKTVRTLEDLIKHDPDRADLYRRCLVRLEGGYDL